MPKYIAFIFALSVSGIANAELVENLHKIDHEIVIDGSLEDWAGHPYDALGFNLPFEKSLSGVFYQGWSEEGLLFAANTLDETVITHSKNREDQRTQDCLELFLDSRGLNSGPKDILANNEVLSIDWLEVSSDNGTSNVIDDRDQAIQYSPEGWTMVNRLDCFLGGFHRAIEGASPWLKYHFFGNRIKIGSRLRNVARFDMYIDGEKIDYTYDFRFNDRMEMVFDSGMLKPGKHELEIKRMEVPTHGVHHFLIRPSADGGKQLFHYNSQGEVDSTIPLETSVLETGWRVEGLIPWKLLEGFNPQVGAVLRFGYKVYDSDNIKDKSINTLGLRRHGSGTEVDWMLLNPDRFPRVRLAGVSPYVIFDSYAQEELFQLKSWVKLIIKKPIEKDLSKDENEPIPIMVTNSLDETMNLYLQPSAGGRFLGIEQLIPTDWFGSESDRIRFVVSVIDSQNSQLDFDIDPKLRNSIRQIHEKLPEEKLLSISAERRKYVRFYKQCAIDLSHFLTVPLNRDIPHYNYIPFYDEPKRLTAYMDIFLEKADQWMTNEITSDEIKYHRLQVWESQADESLQYFHMSLPKDFDPAQSYPIKLKMHIDNKKTFSRVYDLARRAIPKHRVLGANEPRNEQEIQISLNGRGNSQQQLGDEEFSYVISWIKKVFPNSLDDINIWGGSSGGRKGMDMAIKWPDQFSYLDLRANSIARPTLKLSNDNYDDPNRFKFFSQSMYDDILNLKNLPVRITIGGADRLIYVNRLLYYILKYENPGCEMIVVPGFTHEIPDAHVPPFPFKPRNLNEIPSSFAHRSWSLRYGTAFGITAIEKRYSWRPFSFSVSRQSEKSIQVEIENLTSFSLNESFFADSQYMEIREFVINGQKLKLDQSLNATGICLFSILGDQWTLGKISHDTELEKTGHLQGPIADVEKEGFIIVYGTLDKSTETSLFKRARNIVAHRVGSDIGQWEGGRFLVKADVDVTAEELNSRNLWLIGGRQENKLVAKYAKELPFSLLENELPEISDWGDESLFLQFIYPNPINRNTYWFIEAGGSTECYASSILREKEFDFSVSRFDAQTNPVLVCGIFDSTWGLNPEQAKIWDGSLIKYN